MFEAFCFAIGLSISLNAYFLLKKRHTSKETEVSQFTRDLQRYGSALVRIQVIDPQDIYLKSPRDV